MTEPDDTRLEHELRDALDRRDPGPAPLTLRERVLRVPNEPPTRADKGRGAIQAVLGLAAVVALMVVAVGVSGRPGPAVSSATPTSRAALATPGGSPATSSGAPPSAPEPAPTPFPTVSAPPYSPKPGETPLPVSATLDAGASFDASLDGVGVRLHVDDGSGERWLIGIAICILAAFALTIGGRRRILPAVAAMALTLWVLVATFVPVVLTNSGGGGGLYVAYAPKPVGFGEDVLYEVAPALQAFAFNVGDVHAESILPVRLEAVEAPNWNFEDFVALKYTAAWLDRENSGSGGSWGPVAPLTSTDLSGFHSIWIVGRAGACSPGPVYYPNEPGDGWTGLGSELTAEINVLGIPRRVALQMRFSVVEPNSVPCAPDRSTVSAPPLPSGSSAP